MSLITRLERLTPALSGRKRALLVLQSMKDETPEDPAWRSTMPPEQYHEFNRCIHLINAATQEARVLINLLEDQADCLELREGWLVSVILWSEQVEEIRDVLPARTASRLAVQNVLEWKPEDASPGDEDVNFPELLRRSLSEQLAYRLIFAWVELSSLVTVVDEIAAAFDGEDPLLPSSRDKLESTRQRLLAVRDHLLGLNVEVVLREPLAEEVEALREFVLREVQ